MDKTTCDGGNMQRFSFQSHVFVAQQIIGSLQIYPAFQARIGLHFASTAPVYVGGQNLS